MLRRPHYIALGLVVLLTLVVLKLPGRTTASLKLAIGGVFLPLFGLAGSVDSALDKSGNGLLPRSELVRQLEAAQRENQEWRLRGVQAEATVKENSRFREHYGWERQQPWRFRLARVVSRDPANWWRAIKIDAGARDGVVTNSPVLTLEGLVGRVSEVGFAQSQVVLLGDPNCRVSVKVEDPPHEQGVIAPASSSPLDNTLVDLGYLSRNAKLKAGQRVVTSGQGGIFPPGLVVGQIVDWRSVGFGLYTEARVKLEVKMNTLEEVWVKLP